MTRLSENNISFSQRTHLGSHVTVGSMGSNPSEADNDIQICNKLRAFLDHRKISHYSFNQLRNELGLFLIVSVGEVKDSIVEFLQLRIAKLDAIFTKRVDSEVFLLTIDLLFFL